MISQEHYDRIARALSILQRADPKLVQEFQQSAYFARIPAGKDVFVEGDRVIKGQVYNRTSMINSDNNGAGLTFQYYRPDQQKAPSYLSM